MNDLSQHEPDDELLSAYLDDELSADERAHVESRLAADPAARQTLEHLRSVSQSVRDLPTEGIGRDLRDIILQRAATASQAVPGSESQLTSTKSTQHSQPVSPLPPISIGRTTRAWVWATVAIAAGLLIMFLQPGDNSNLPSIAQNKPTQNDAARTSRQLADKDSRERFAQGQASSVADASQPEPTDMPAAPSPTTKNFNGGGIGGRVATTAPASEPPSVGSRLESVAAPTQLDDVALQTPAAAAPAPMAAAASRAAGEQSAGSAASTPQPVVVRVLARRSAMDNKVFESLLQKHNVDVETTADRFDAQGALAFDGNSIETSSSVEAPLESTLAKSESEDKESETAPEAEGRGRKLQEESSKHDDVDFVLVDAPVSTIFSCLNDLKTDAENFTGIAVDNRAPADKALPAETAATDTTELKRAPDLVRFNRGVVPQSQDTLTRADSYYSYWDDERSKSLSQSPIDAKSRDFGSDSQRRGFTFTDEAKSNRGRALRLPERAGGGLGGRGQRTQDRNGSVPPSEYGLSAAVGDKEKALEQLGAPTNAAQDRMQVLFVIQPSDEPSPSLKAKNQAE
jgi:hypothetical protein